MCSLLCPIYINIKTYLGGFHYSALCECSNEVLCASVLVKSGLKNLDYGRRGSAALAMRHPYISKSWH
jgi:hypothetical protein